MQHQDVGDGQQHHAGNFASVVAAAYLTTQSWPTVIPLWAMAGGIGGLYPAIRASRLAPTTALAN